MSAMAVTAKKLDVRIGDLVEIDGRKYEWSRTNRAASRWSSRTRLQRSSLRMA